MTAPTPRIAPLHDIENRMRRDWQRFVSVWQQTESSWRDRRRQEFEEAHLRELPATLQRVQAELVQYREVLGRAARALAEDDSRS